MTIAIALSPIGGKSPALGAHLKPQSKHVLF
jgi:hypothetical protein